MVTNVTGIATDFITFSRASNATVTNNVGLIAWAPHNLLTNSEQFDASSWQKTNDGSTSPVISANLGVAPNATTTADKCDFGVIDGTTDASILYQSLTLTEGTYTGRIWIKAFSSGDIGKKVWVYLYDTARRGQIEVTITDSWQEISVSSALTGGASRGMFVATFGATYGGINQSVVSVYLWGAALYRSDLAGMQPNASTNPAFSYYNSTTPKNLLGYTEDFSNAYWAKVASTVISNIIPAPNGLMSADKIVASSAASTWHVVRVLNAFGSGPTTISVYAKAAEYSLFRVADYDNGVYYASFDLVNGTVISDTTGGTKYVSASITFAGDGWYRCSVVVDAVSASRAVGFGGYPSGATLDNFGAKFTGNDISGVYIWGAQVSDSASIDAYSPNYFAAPSSAAYYGPRRDFSPTTLACNGLLVEEQRTNLLLHSAAFDNASWVKTRTTVTANAVASPDGTVTADKLIEDASTNTHFINQSVTTTAANHTFTVFAKAAERSFVLLYHIETNSGAMFNLSNGAMTTASTVTLATSSATAVGGGWYRCAITVAATAASNGFRVYTSDNSSTFNYAGDGTSGIYLWGAQVEAGSFPTSLIPTGAATATRAADVASVSTQAFPYSSSASTLVLATTLLGTSVGNKLLELSAAKPSGSTSANGLLIYQSSNLLRLNAYVDASSVILGDATVGAVQKVGIAYDGSDNGAVRNGGTVSSVGTTVSAAATKLSIGTGFNDASVMNGHIRQITYLPRRISNAELQTRTT